MLQELLRRLAQILGFIRPPAAIAESINQTRARFSTAYNNQDYATLCDIFHEHAKFRGSVYPERWTFGRDSIMTERYMSSETCTAIRAGATAIPKEGTRSVGSMTLSLRSERITPIGTNYIADTGAFDMIVRPGHDATPTAGPYVILWRRENNDWKMIHIDMNP
jgi:hypothetical protein